MKVSYAVPMLKDKGIEGKDEKGRCLSNKNNLEFIDTDCLSEEFKGKLAAFAEAVLKNQELKGKNKPSWKTDDNRDITYAVTFEENKCWHYHCGPYKDYNPKPPTINLAFNPNGRISAPVIHYRKLSEDHIVITAFSPKHIPFPSASSTSPILRKSDEELLAELDKVLST